MTRRVIELVREATQRDGRGDDAPRGCRCVSTGLSRRSNPVVAVGCGADRGPVCVVVAGMHSDELTGVAAAESVVRSVYERLASGVRLEVVPAVDVDGVRDNIRGVDPDAPVVSLLDLQLHRDLEGEFCDGDHPEADAVRRWLASFERIDAFVSLHATNHLVPGGFSYLGGSESQLVETMARVLEARMAAWGVPRLASDPTGMGGQRLSDGVFGIPRVEGSSLEFVRRRFDPALMAVTELPVGLVEPHGPISLEKLDVWKNAAATSEPADPGDIIALVDDQVELLTQFVFDVCRGVAALESPS